jgi:hypothetical protein
MTTHPATPAVDWSPRYGALGGTASAASVAAAAGAVGDLLDWPALWPVCAGVAGVLLVALAARVHTPAGLTADQVAARRRLTIFYAVAWLAAAGWVAYVYEWSTVVARQPWPPYLLGVTLLGITALILTPRQRHTDPDVTGTGPSAVQPTPRPHQEWEDRLARICRIATPAVTTVTPWDSGNGITVAGICPDDGTTWQQLQPYAAALASHLRLPHGCGCEFGPGVDRGAFTLRVNTRDAMATERPYPERLPVRSIHDPIVIGWHRDDDPTELATLREDQIMAAGGTGSGKTNLLQDLNAGYQQCDDVLHWGIDLNGGAMVLPWLSPWLEGAVDRPALDWVATTVPEAIRMVEFAIDVAVARRRLYRQLMRELNVDMVPVSSRIPMIRIVLDEGAEAGSIEANSRLRAGIIRLTELGRAGGARIDVSVLRATADVIPVRVKRQIGVRIGLKVSDEEEANHLFGWKFRPDPADTPYKGSGLIRPTLEAPVRPFRTYRTALPGTVWRIAVDCAARRPVLDEPSLNAAGRAVYEDRWRRTMPYLTNDDEAYDAQDDAQDDAPAAQPAPPTAQRSTTTTAQPAAQRDAPRGAPRDEDPPPSRRNAPAAVFDFSAVRRQIDAARTRHDPEALDEQWQGMLTNPSLADLQQIADGQPRETDQGRAGDRPWIPAAVQLLDAAGPRGMSADELVAALRGKGLQVSRATLYRESSGFPGHPDVTTVRGRGFLHRRHAG